MIEISSQKSLLLTLSPSVPFFKKEFLQKNVHISTLDAFSKPDAEPVYNRANSLGWLFKKCSQTKPPTSSFLSGPKLNLSPWLSLKCYSGISTMNMLQICLDRIDFKGAVVDLRRGVERLSKGTIINVLFYSLGADQLIL